MGEYNIIYWLGTNFIPGSLHLNFTDPFTDGAGTDFAIRTSNEGWGSLADNARIDFYMGTTFVDLMNVSLVGGQILEFELPGSSIYADTIAITNTTQNPNNQLNCNTDMAFIDAGIAHQYSLPSTIPEPTTMLMFGVGTFIAGLVFKKKEGANY